ncbi:ArsR family transcriptional regulator [Halopenitus sp. POP-27]|uniref:winged helix-turn-helix transcriptional regulator n=1 Tax=Halopenitus sp. POP-27 TaxID=2994425 RepID=UPI0024696488|nr:ArsR family transcriptional regulator [Halopenitus sp. POP-27]
MSDTRDRIRRHVHATPGLHFRRIGRDLDLATGQVQYHLRRLTREGTVVKEPVGGKTHYFAPSFDPWDRRTIAFLRRETARGIVVRLAADGDRRPGTLAADLDLAESTVSWHLSTLAEHDIVEKSPSSPMTVSLTRPARTAQLVDTVSPSVSDRLVDRFLRSVDELL